MNRTIGYCTETRPESCGFVLFGATGDLAARKIIPALAGLCAQELIPKRFYVLFVARTALDRAAFEARLAAALAGHPECAKALLSRSEYLQADYDSPAFYRELAARLAELDEKHGIKNKRLFYLATPPPAFEPIAMKLKDSGLLSDPGDSSCWSRIIIEKPYGSSLASACSLDSGLKKTVPESQIYRIDHFTGKETVQNLLALRSGNPLFEETWNGRLLDHVQITVFEELGLEGRAGFFEHMGLARDMMSHILQLAAVTAMDLPPGFGEKEFKEQKRKFFESVVVPDPSSAADFVRAQYSGYAAEPGVAPGSKTETFLAFKLRVDNDRWRGVPFYVRAGKKTGRKLTRIDLVYKKPSSGVFSGTDTGFTNVFSVNIQPKENLSLSLVTKHPGPKACFTVRDMGLEYREHEEEYAVPDGYARLLLEAMAGDKTLFLSAFEMNFLWEYLSPLLSAWSAPDAPLHRYADGTDGPAAARELPERDGRSWL